jgi:cell cycle sensor histidine kinase DivJ
VQDDVPARRQHVRFIAAHLASGLAASLAFPFYIAAFGPPGPYIAFAFICLVAPLGSALYVARTGRLEVGLDQSSLLFSGLVVAVALPTGGIASPVLPWLVAIPLEAMVAGSRRNIAVAAICALGAIIALAGFTSAGLARDMAAWASWTAAPVMAGGAIIHAALIARAIHRDRMRNERETVERDMRDRLVFDTIDDLITWHDRSGAILFASPASQTILGLLPRVLKGQGLFERVLVSDRPAYLKAITDVANGLPSASVQFRLTRQDNKGKSSVVWVEMRARRVLETNDSTDDATAVIAVTRDITRLKQHEAELDAARAQAEAANVSKGRFLATVSHELRTPLNAIIGFSEILANADFDAIDDARRVEYARIVHTSGHHLNEVVGALLDMSKIETGNFDFNPERTDPAEVARSSCDLMRLKAQEAGIALDISIDPGTNQLVADRRALKQIVLNLLSNAVKFTPKGGSVSLALRQDGGHVLFVVSDTGIGIDPVDLPRLGQPFFQAGSSYARRYEGTGLGLSVVKGLVGLHRGSLTIESATDVGTIVTVHLPRDCRDMPSGSGEARIETLVRETNLIQPIHEMVKKSA